MMRNKGFQRALALGLIIAAVLQMVAASRAKPNNK